MKNYMQLFGFFTLSFILFNCTKSEGYVKRQNIYYLFVSDRMENCNIDFTNKCIQVKKSTGGWITFDQEIVGFEYEEGVSYKLKIKEVAIIDNYSSNKSFEYKLDSLVAKNLFETIDLYISHKLGACKSNENSCFLVKNSKTDTWENFDYEIENFDYQKGYEYHILALKFKKTIDTPQKYELFKVIEKIKK